MDMILVVGILVFGLVVFFGYQWWSGPARRPVAAAANEPMANFKPEPQPPNPLPVIPGQTEEEQQHREPNQQHTRSVLPPQQQQEPVYDDIPRQSQTPHLSVSEIPGSEGIQGSAAQNEGPLIGGVFAFDGMESSGMAPL